jgi:hypothetical protein
MKLTNIYQQVLESILFEDIFMDKITSIFHTKLQTRLPNVSLKDFDQDALRLGVVHELQRQNEQERSVNKAVFYAMKHLKEKPHYYDHADIQPGVNPTNYYDLIHRGNTTGFLR